MQGTIDVFGPSWFDCGRSVITAVNGSKTSDKYIDTPARPYISIEHVCRQPQFRQESYSLNQDVRAAFCHAVQFQGQRQGLVGLGILDMVRSFLAGIASDVATRDPMIGRVRLLMAADIAGVGGKAFTFLSVPHYDRGILEQGSCMIYLTDG